MLNTQAEETHEGMHKETFTTQGKSRKRKGGRARKLQLLEKRISKIFI
jgi:hypothetical protein